MLYPLLPEYCITVGGKIVLEGQSRSVGTTGRALGNRRYSCQVFSLTVHGSGRSSRYNGTAVHACKSGRSYLNSVGNLVDVLECVQFEALEGIKK